MTRSKNMEHVEVLRDLRDLARAAIDAGDWKVDGACDPDAVLRRADSAIAALSAPQPPAEAQPAPSAPVGVEGLVGNWKARAETKRAESKNKDWAEWLRENHAGAASAFTTCARELSAALAQQPAAVDGAAKLQAEVEALRAEVRDLRRRQGAWERHVAAAGCEYVRDGEHDALVNRRAERLAEALRELVEYVQETAHHNAPAAAAARAALRDYDQEGKDG